MYNRGFGMIVAAASAGLTFLTFVIAVSTLPLSGPFCRDGCFTYPYLEIADRFPRQGGSSMSNRITTGGYLPVGRQHQSYSG